MREARSMVKTDPPSPQRARGTTFGLLVPLGLIVCGIVIRIAQYAHYRALFHDEGILASNALDLSLKELFLPYGNSMAPGLYMVLAKLFLHIGGINEYAARSVPFLGSILLVLIFYPVANRLSTRAGATVALAFLVSAKYLIEFGDYVRPYSSDAFIAIALIGLTLYAEEGKPQYRRHLVLGLSGALAIWFSYPAVFVLVGIGVVQLSTVVLERNTPQLHYSLFPWCFWGVSFLTFYLISIRVIQTDADTMFLMNDYYQYANAFMPLPPTSFEDLKWFNYHLIKMFDYPGGMTLPGLAAFAFVMGVISLYRRNKKQLAYLLAPLAMALLASGLEQYPFWARTILWLSPILYILMGEGIASLWKGRKHAESTIAVILLAMLVVVPGVRALRMIPQPSSHHELNKALDHYMEQRRPGDLLYIRFDDTDAFRFCQWHYAVTPDDALVEPDLGGSHEREVEFFAQHLPRINKKSRVWFTLCYDFPYLVTPFIELLDEHGTRLEEQHALGASVYLYEFNEK